MNLTLKNWPKLTLCSRYTHAKNILTEMSFCELPQHAISVSSGSCNLLLFLLFQRSGIPYPEFFSYEIVNICQTAVGNYFVLIHALIQISMSLVKEYDWWSLECTNWIMKGNYTKLVVILERLPPINSSTKCTKCQKYS